MIREADPYSNTLPIKRPIYTPSQPITSPTGGGADIGPTRPPTPLPSPTTPQPGGTPNAMTDMLERFGYMGKMPINPYEQMGLDWIRNQAGQQTGLQTMQPGADFLTQLVSGQFGPQGQAFRQQVYEPVEERTFRNLERAQDLLGEKFSHAGGFFGGKHAIAQGELGAQMLSPLTEMLANLNLAGFQGDIANRMGAAGGLESMGGTQQGISSDILRNIMGGGQMVTGREALNRAEQQAAQERVYQDWLRAREETMMPFNLVSSLLGAQPFQNIVQQPQPSPWGQLLGGIGTGGTMFGLSKL